MKIIVILFISLLNGQNLLDYLSGPIILKIGLINGYDDNVLRFSDIEKSPASTDKYIMGGANTLTPISLDILSLLIKAYI